MELSSSPSAAKGSPNQDLQDAKPVLPGSVEAPEAGVPVIRGSPSFVSSRSMRFSSQPRKEQKKEQKKTNFNQFISTKTHNRVVQLSRGQLKTIEEKFRRLDKNGDGFVSAQELKEATSGGLIRKDIAEQLVEAAMEGADQSQDGLLDWEEFVSLHVEEGPGFYQRNRNKIEAGCCIFYFILAPLVYCNFNTDPDLPDWSVWDALYFATTTVTTVGYGDLGPVTDEMKIFTMFYILYGLIIVAGVVSNVAAAMIAWYEERLKAAQGSMLSAVTSVAKHSSRKSIDLSPVSSMHVESPPEVTSLPLATSVADLAPHYSGNTEMVKLVTRKLLLSLALFLFPIFVGTVFFKFNEEWSWIDAMYWSLVTTTTVGFGDLRLEHESSRIFSIFFILLGFMFVGGAIGNVGSMKLELRCLQERSKMMKRTLSTKMIADLDRDGNGVERWEFLCAMLVQLGKVTEEDLQPLLDKFEELDTDGSGKLTHDDLQALRKKKMTMRSSSGMEGSPNDV